MLDNDGTLWDNNQATKLEGVSASVEKLRRLGKRLLFLSNNPLLNKEEFIANFAKLGDFSAGPDEIIAVKDALITYLRDNAVVKGKLYMVCDEGLEKHLQEAGFCPTGTGANPEPEVTYVMGGMKKFYAVKLEKDTGAVLVSMDGCSNYNKLFKSLNYLDNPDCQLIALSTEQAVRIPMGRISRIVPVLVVLWLQ